MSPDTTPDNCLTVSNWFSKFHTRLTTAAVSLLIIPKVCVLLQILWPSSSSRLKCCWLRTQRKLHLEARHWQFPDTRARNHSTSVRPRSPGPDIRWARGPRGSWTWPPCRCTPSESLHLRLPERAGSENMLIKNKINHNVVLLAVKFPPSLFPTFYINR